MSDHWNLPGILGRIPWVVKDFTAESWKWNIILPRKQLFWREVSYFPLKPNCREEEFPDLFWLIYHILIHIVSTLYTYIIYSTTISYILLAPPFLKGPYFPFNTSLLCRVKLLIPGWHLPVTNQISFERQSMAKVLAFFRGLLSLWKKGGMFSIFKHTPKIIK